jgi:hypothetical protein
MFWGRYADLGSLQGIVFGVFISSLIYLFLFMLLDFGLTEKAHDYVIAFLVTASTVFAAGIALRGSRAQILQAESLEEVRRLRSLSAAVATLPLALSNIADACMNNMKRHFDANDLASGGPQVTEFASIDAETMVTLKECIQFSDAVTRGKMQSVIRSYQVLRSRNEGLQIGHHIQAHQQNIAADHKQVNDVLHWAALHALTAHMFAFARGEVESVPQAWDSDQVKAAMWLAGVDFYAFPNIGKLYEARRNGGRLAMFDA